MFPCIFRAENLIVVPLMEYNLAISLLLHVDVWHTFKRYVQIKDQYCQYTEHMLIKNIWRMFLKALYNTHKNTLGETKFVVLGYSSTVHFKTWTAWLRFHFERLDDIFIYILTYQKKRKKIPREIPLYWIKEQLPNCFECMVFQMLRQFNVRIVRKKKKLTSLAILKSSSNSVLKTVNIFPVRTQSIKQLNFQTGTQVNWEMPLVDNNNECIILILESSYFFLSFSFKVLQNLQQLSLLHILKNEMKMHCGQSMTVVNIYQ